MKKTLYISLSLISLLNYSSTHSMAVRKEFPKSISGLPMKVIDANDTIDYVDSLNYNLNRLASGNYSAVKNKCIKERNRLFIEYTNAINDSSKHVTLNTGGPLVENILINEIFPYWYGTSWDFEGHTNIPGKGKIACGYFVSTTLHHIGFCINRYKLAQQNPENEALSLSISGDIMRFTGITPLELKKQFIENNEKEGIYFAGLDCHVGYLLFRKNELFFIHANYLGDDGVMIEYAEKSQALRSSNYYIVKITTNNELMQKWILNQEIVVKHH